MTEGAAPHPRFTALVLAGRRSSEDPVAQVAGVSDKCLAPVAGVVMIERVLRALVQSPWVSRVLVSLQDPEMLEDIPGIAALRAARPIEAVASGPSPSLSVLAALDLSNPAFPVLVTTADHALLQSDLVDLFCARASGNGADIVAGLTPATVIERDYPQTRRTYLRFREARYSGANLFALLTPQARGAVAFWRRAERERKRPWRLALAIGPRVLFAYLLGRLSLAGALQRLSRLSGARAAVVALEVSEAAIDVDKPEDLRLVEEILTKRERAEPA